LFQRSSGISETASVPASNIAQNESRSGAPGSRHEAPTIAIGSAAAPEAPVPDMSKSYRERFKPNSGVIPSL